jgi:hypothetical protein
MPVHAPPPPAIGWHIRDPGPPPHSPLLDSVPWSDDRSQLLALHDQWRRDVEADSRRLAARHATAKIWFPVVRPQNRPVVPFYGGSPSTWAAALGTVTSSLVATGYDRIRIVNLSRQDVLQRFLGAKRLRWSGIGVAVSAAGPEAVLVMGADHLAPEVLNSLTGSAHRNGLQLLLFFERLTGPGEQLLGAAGSPYAVFLTLSNPDDAEKAAAFIGREYTFVVNGYSVADGSSEEWSTGRQVGTDQTTTRSWNFGQGFGSSVARGLSRSNSLTSTSGGGRSKTTTLSLGRVHEYVLEPEELMRLPDRAMLVIERDQATLAFCDPAIAALPVTVGHP